METDQENLQDLSTHKKSFDHKNVFDHEIGTGFDQKIVDNLVHFGMPYSGNSV